MALVNPTVASIFDAELIVTVMFVTVLADGDVMFQRTAPLQVLSFI